MKTFYLLSFILCIPFASISQETTHKNRISKIWLNLKDDSVQTQAYLFGLKDSSILITNSIVSKQYSTSYSEIQPIQIKGIEMIQLRRKHKKVTGMLLGTITGIITGAIIGYSIGINAGDDPPCKGFLWCNRRTAEEKAQINSIVGAIFLSAAGFGIGTSIGSIKVEIPIKGDINNYNKYKKKLIRHSYTY